MMNTITIIALALTWIALLLGGFLSWQLLRQNGRILLRLDDIEERLHQLEVSEAEELADASGSEEARANRFGNRSLARSRINRSGLKAGTSAPDFRLPRLDGGYLSLEDFRGQRLLLVFSDPHCGPCEALAPQLQKLHRDHPEVAMLIISRGEPKANRAKVKEHGLSFPVVLQRHWEISRKYAMFATPIAYLIDEAGLIAMDVAVGVEAIQMLLRELMADRQLTTTNTFGQVLKVKLTSRRMSPPVVTLKTVFSCH
jgi:peroxiredoxin